LEKISFHTSAEIRAKMRARRKREEKIGVQGAKRNSIVAQLVTDHAITETEKNKIIQPQLQISKKSATQDISCLKEWTQPPPTNPRAEPSEPSAMQSRGRLVHQSTSCLPQAPPKTLQPHPPSSTSRTTR